MMAPDTFHPTSYPDVNAIVYELQTSVTAILGPHLVGMYLEGSLNSDAFDDASDIDFLVITEDEITDEQFAQLQQMHERIATLPSRWALDLEGSYIGRRALRRLDRQNNTHPNLERGRGERLKWVQHDAAWVIHRSILLERGITVFGPPPQELVDPVSATDLRQALASMFPTWSAPLLKDPVHIQGRGYQSYVVLSCCRVLYTLHYGTVASKATAARWAQTALDDKWAPLIERAIEGRHQPNLQVTPEDIALTQELMRETLQAIGNGR